MSRADVIVPNADLIKNQVTNYMFRDPYWRVECKVGVAYGSDTELVKQTLLEVAQNHQNVVQDEANGPAVLFKQFGDSALNFELWCIIKNVNSKYVVESELNFAIDKAFREKRITIAFPQRDVHIYQQNNNDLATPEDDNA
jgi:small-conductance mechanosensitive channel